MTVSITNTETGEVSADCVPQDGAIAVYEEHIRALNAYDWAAIVAQYPDDAEIHLVGGVVVKGRSAIGEMFQGAVKPISEMGHKGLTFSEVSRLHVGDTVVVNWITHADWLAEPYRGSDAYVTDGKYMVSMVTTFDYDNLKFK